MTALTLPVPAHAAPIEVRDDTGRTIRLEKPAERIIALYGAYNEILAAMGLGERLVARTKADGLPPSILAKPSIGTHMRPNVEAVLALKPDLIIQGAGRTDAMMPVQQLMRQGLKVAVFNPVTFAQLFSVMDRIGILTGERPKAQRLIESYRARLNAVKSRAARTGHRPKVFFEVRYPNLLGAGAKSIVNDVIEYAGGVNCVTLPKKLVRLDIESLIAFNPDLYVVQRGPMNRGPSRLSERPHFYLLDAVKTGRILYVDEQVFSRPGPRSVDAVEQLARALHRAVAAR
ncbi:MAG: ABC transporter substrate-binding protein [Deltaproteobacteria bacterium]